MCRKYLRPLGCLENASIHSDIKEVFSFFFPRVPLRRAPSIRSQLRAIGLLEDFLKEHQPDAFSRRYAQCYPPGTPSLRLGRSAEKIYNFMDVS